MRRHGVQRRVALAQCACRTAGCGYAAAFVPLAGPSAAIVGMRTHAWQVCAPQLALEASMHNAAGSGPQEVMITMRLVGFGPGGSDEAEAETVAPWREGCDDDGQKEEGHCPKRKHSCCCELDWAHELGNNLLPASEAQLFADSRLGSINALQPRTYG